MDRKSALPRRTDGLEADRQTAGRSSERTQPMHAVPLANAASHKSFKYAKKTYIIILAKAKIMRERPGIMIIDNWAVAGEQ